MGLTGAGADGAWTGGVPRRALGLTGVGPGGLPEGWEDPQGNGAVKMAARRRPEGYQEKPRDSMALRTEYANSSLAEVSGPVRRKSLSQTS